VPFIRGKAAGVAQPSKVACGDDPGVPSRLAAYCFRIDDDEFVVLSFDVVGAPPNPGLLAQVRRSETP
jgi:hypothetical protein